MGGLSLMHWAIVAVIVLLLFGKGRLSATMGDVGKGLRNFRQGLAEDEQPALTVGEPPSPVA